MSDRLDVDDLEMHELRNRTLRRILHSALAVNVALESAARARWLSARSRRPSPWVRTLAPARPGKARTRRARLRLVPATPQR